MKPLALTPSEQRRLEKLAKEAGRTPAQILKFVLRDGFDFCEWEVRESRAADESFKRHGAIPHAEVMRQGRAIIDTAHGRRRKQAA